MTHDLLARKINPQNVKDLLNDTQSQEPIKKVRIYDDPGEVVRTRNKLKRQRTNEIYTDEYFSQFHSTKIENEKVA